MCVEVKLSQASPSYAEQWMVEDDRGRAVHGPPMELGGEITVSNREPLGLPCKQQPAKKQGRL